MFHSFTINCVLTSKETRVTRAGLGLFMNKLIQQVLNVELHKLIDSHVLRQAYDYSLFIKLQKLV